jgi:hypothetical protein
VAQVARCWGIRHLRWAWHAHRLGRWFAIWRQYGALHPHPRDVVHLENIWRGDA